MRSTPAAAALLFLMCAVAPPAAGAAQIELDRIVSRVGGQIITQSDIRRARTLRLVDDVSSDQAAQRALETLMLILSELGRAAPLPPISDDDLATRRAGWTSAVGGEAKAEALLAQQGMSRTELDAWLQDDLRVQAYLRRQFGMLPEAERGRAISDWLSRLRQRSDLR